MPKELRKWACRFASSNLFRDTNSMGTKESRPNLELLKAITLEEMLEANRWAISRRMVGLSERVCAAMFIGLNYDGERVEGGGIDPILRVDGKAIIVLKDDKSEEKQQ
jgi:hypothetical protein